MTYFLFRFFYRWLDQRLLDRIDDLERELFQSQQFERIAAEKLKTWVQKHDELLVKYKALKATHEPSTINTVSN